MMHRFWPLATILALAFGAPGALPQEHGHGHGQPGQEPGEQNEAPGHGHGASTHHGGRVTMTKEFHFEVVWLRDRIQVYLYDREQKAIPFGSATGEAEVTLGGGEIRKVRLALEPGKRGEHQGHAEGHGDKPIDRLAGRVDLSNVREAEARATFRISGLPGTQEKEVSFRQAFHLARQIQFRCPNHPEALKDAPGECARKDGRMERVAVSYTCPMHPKVVERDPRARCPDCGMKLDPKVEPLEAESAKSPQGHKHGDRL